MKVVNAITWIIPVAILAVGLYMFNLWQNFKDPQGDASNNCNKVELPAIRNHSGLVVTAHNTVCDVFGGTSAIYVYVHKWGAAEDRANLVFRYIDRYDAASPRFDWINESSLLISVNHISEVSKKLNTMQGVTISYAVGKIDYDRKK
jgi:hypothetical protein